MLDSGTYDAYVKQEVEDTFVTQNLENVTNNDGSNVTSNVTRVTIDCFTEFLNIQIFG